MTIENKLGITSSAALAREEEKISKKKTMIVTDSDLFPPGTIRLNGVKAYGEEMGNWFK